MLIVALTGGIGAGKSTVAEFFRRRGAAIIDTDQIARELTAPGNLVLRRIVKSFGREILNEDGSLNRAALGKIVFSSKNERTRLNEITHPPIMAETFKRTWKLASSEEPPKLAVVVVPLLLESGTEDRFDKIIAVTANDEVRLARLKERDKLSEEEIRARIDSQFPQEKFAARADFVIDNSSELARTEEQVNDVWHKLIG